MLIKTRFFCKLFIVSYGEKIARMYRRWIIFHFLDATATLSFASYCIIFVSIYSTKWEFLKNVR